MAAAAPLYTDQKARWLEADRCTGVHFLKAVHPDWSIASWSVRFCLEKEDVRICNGKEEM